MASIKDKLKTINISDIKPYKANAKKHPQSQIENLKTSIDKYGYYSPVGVDKNNEIVIGHGRYLALMEADSEQQVEVVDFSNLSQKEIKKLRILDNKIVSDEWDMELLQKEIEDIYDNGEDPADILKELSLEKGFLGDLEIDFLDKNMEIDVDNLNDDCVLKIQFSADKYELVLKELRKYGNSDSEALLKVLHI